MASKKKHQYKPQIFVRADQYLLNTEVCEEVRDFVMSDGETCLIGEYKLQRVIRVTKRLQVDQQVVEEV